MQEYVRVSKAATPQLFEESLTYSGVHRFRVVFGDRTVQFVQKYSNVDDGAGPRVSLIWPREPDASHMEYLFIDLKSEEGFNGFWEALKAVASKEPDV